MKSYPGNAGNVKMRGKKHKLLSCGCCMCQDFRHKYNMELMRKDIEGYNSLDTKQQVEELYKEETGNVGQW